MMKKQLLLLVMMLLPMAALADAVEIDGIYYYLNSGTKTAEVTKNPNKSASVAIPEKVKYEETEYSVTSIGDNAFYWCSDLTSITIPNSVTSIGGSAFYECWRLTSITIPNSVTSIGDCAFYGCSDLSTTISNSVTSIGDHAFAGCSKLSTTIPNSVTSIGDGAFASCWRLTSITIPNSVTSIGRDAFTYTGWYSKQSDGLLYLDNWILGYKGYSQTGEIKIAENTKGIADGAFSSCSGLTSITIPNSVTSIGVGAFSCSGLTSIKVESGNTKYDSRDNCNAIIETASNTLLAGCQNTTIPNSVTSIGDCAFSSCSGLTSIIIPNSVTSIGGYAFTGCSGLTSITIPNSVTSIGNKAFSNCSGLTSVTIGNSVTSIGQEAFWGCSGLTSITIPNSVTSIGSGAFYWCSGLISVTIPNSLTSIGMDAFYACSGLTSIVIGGGIKTIDGRAFANCPDLTDVTCYAEDVPSTQSNAFEGSYVEFATLHVPDASVNAYSQAEPWKNFKEIVGLNGSTPVEPEKCATPTISYRNGKLTFACETEGAECVATIDDADIKTHYGNEVNLTATYNISVYATKNGYDNSDVATATLCWIAQEPQTEGITNGVAQIPSKAVLIQSEGGIVKVEGIDDGTTVTLYTPDGKQAGSAVCRNGAALVGTSIQPGSIAIVKIGEKSVKVVIK